MGRIVDTIYKKNENSDYTHINIKSDAYNYTTVVDTKFVKYLELFSWNKLNTDDGIYFSARNTNIANRLCVQKLGLPFEIGKTLLLHRLVAYMAQLPNPEVHATVDHIDRETLDNRSENLRWLSQADQNRNTNKRNRKVGSRELPDDIEVPLPKYITWNVSNETTKAGKVLQRKFFRIETHPAQNNKTWTTTKRADVSNQDKLNQAKEQLARLNTISKPEDPRIKQIFDEYHELLQRK